MSWKAAPRGPRVAPPEEALDANPTDMLTLIKLQTLFKDLARKGMTQVFEDWETLVGFSAASEAGPIRVAESLHALLPEMPERHLIVETCLEKGDDLAGPVYFVFPGAFVLEVVAEMMMLPDAAKEEKARVGMNESDIEAFREMANLLCGSWNRSIGIAERDLKISQSVDHLKIWQSLDGVDALTSAIPDGRAAWIHLDVSAAGEHYDAFMILSVSVALTIAEVLLEVDRHPLLRSESED